EDIEDSAEVFEKDEPLETITEGNAAFQSTDSKLLSDDMGSSKNFSITEYLEQQAKKEKEEAILLDEKGEESSEYGFDFDARKAIIYSEILKRPFD
ncbi:MAG: hypothetical protein MI922_30700, partial [Bacteroidales bacterium]|nr:hypothetical protein [Bacteroidales bacterium]